MNDAMPKKSATRIASASPQPNGAADTGMWLRVTRELADDLAVDALVRDRGGKPPFDEISRLREAGLPALLLPPGPLGRGADWRTACAVIRDISAADSSIGELLARHYVLSWAPRFFGTPESADRLELRAAEEQWLWGGGTDIPAAGLGTASGEGIGAGIGTGIGTGAETGPARSPELTLTPAPRGYVLSGRKGFATGVGVADRLALGAVCSETGESLIVVVDPAHPAVTTDPAHDRLGQRLTAAGSIGFDSVPVAPDHVLGAVPRDEHDLSPFAALAPLALRLALVHVALGIAEGALAEARDFSRTAPRTWAVTVPDDAAYAAGPGRDPYLLLAYGELVAAAHTAAAVVEPATEALARGLLLGQELGVDERADIAVLVAAAEAVTGKAAMQITTRIMELTDGADSPADDPGFDRFWRNARVLTAQGSLTHSLRDIGDHYLNGTHPALTLRM
ncbi:hypothetical protein T261_7430 [Streptomyces lydicus]|nr:hypothetical protein T261_7430 [Streptomyces lydicus]